MLSLRNVTFSTPHPERLADFWAAALGLPERIDRPDEVLLADVDWPPPRYTFQRVPGALPTTASRVHLDLTADDRGTEVARLVSLGATEGDTHVRDGMTWTIVHDPDGNELCVTQSPGAG